MHMRSKAVVTATASLLFLTGFGAGQLAPVKASESPPEPAEAAPALGSGSTARLPSFGELAARVSPSVVHIKTVSVVNASHRGMQFGRRPSPFGPESQFPQFGPSAPPGGFRSEGTGSGFVIRKDGLILSNNHVISGAKQITVILADQQEYEAKVLGRDEKTDLAVLKIDAKGDLPVAALGDSDALRVGEWVLAIGNPFGLSNTVTAGIVSAKGRVIGAGPYDDFIQTDAPINPGNSGGPLFNENGEVVGINSAIFSQSGGNVGIGFAVPVNLAKSLLPDLENLGSVRRGWLGVSIQTLTPELARSLGLDDAKGALVADVVPDGPAAKAGFARGDVIVGYDGSAVESATALPRLVAATPAGEAVEVEVVRDGSRKTMDVTVEKLADDSSSETAPAKVKWGLALRDLRPEDRQRLGLQGNEGVLVEAVEPGGAAAEAGVQPGDVILQVDRASVASADDVRRRVAAADEDKPLLLLLRRADGGNQFAALTPK